MRENLVILLYHEVKESLSRAGSLIIAAERRICQLSDFSFADTASYMNVSNAFVVTPPTIRNAQIVIVEVLAASASSQMTE